MENSRLSLERDLDASPLGPILDRRVMRLGVLVPTIVGVVVLLVSLAAAAVRGLRRVSSPGLTLRQLRDFHTQTDPVTPITSYYQWQLELWSGLRKGLGAAALTLFLSFLATTFVGSENTQERTVKNQSESVVTTTKHQDADSPIELVAGSVLVLLAFLATREATRIQITFADHASSMTGPS